MAEMLVYCPFCNEQAVPAMKHLKTVRNASRQGRAAAHTEEELLVLGDCQKCHKAKQDIQAQFG